MEFKERLTAPTKSNNYYYKDNIFYKSGYGLPNCTAYAWGRFYELSGQYPRLCTANAENWFKYTKDGYSRGQVPKLGAIAVWSKGIIGKNTDGAGHVAVVEKINSDGSIVTSNSGWKCSLFWLNTYSKGYAKKGYRFEGFIYNPVIFDEPKIIVNPTEDANTYIVKRGDTLSKIASQYKTTYQDLAKYNGIIDPNIIRIGQVIRIPKVENSTPIVPSNQYKVTTGLWLLDNNGKKIKVYPAGTTVTYIADGYIKYGYHYYKVNCNGTIGYMAKKYLQKI